MFTIHRCPSTYVLDQPLGNELGFSACVGIIPQMTPMITVQKNIAVIMSLCLNFILNLSFYASGNPDVFSVGEENE